METTKIFAIYYPQFHSIPENDKAWGDGFTDWVNVKKSLPLFSGHDQPRLPLNDNYYNLSEPSVIEKQALLAKEYGIDGFCFYHYWFDGKLLLEKPLEYFLQNKNLDLQFCLSWANETWSKRWIGDNTIIQEQKHTPEKKIWERHFYYLLNFFNDPRYIKINHKPCFIIYQPNLIVELQNMVEFWQELAIKEGFAGIHLIATKRHDYLPSKIKNNFDGILKFQPLEAYSKISISSKSQFISSWINKLHFLPEYVTDILQKTRLKFTGFRVFNSKDIYECIYDDAFEPIPGFSGDIYESLYVGWDNTPRYGNKATIFTQLQPEEFYENLKRLFFLSEQKSVPFLFINAWNEWAEGAYLEPDLVYKYSYLDMIKKLKSEIIYEKN